MKTKQRRLFAVSIAVLLLVISVFVAYCLEIYNPGVEGMSSTLRTLVTAQASVLAIVFSVAFVATQIVSARYSPAFIKLFVKSPLLRESLYLSIGSIFLSLGVLVCFPVLNLNTKQSLYLWSIQVAGVVLIGVAVYAGLFFEKTTPTNLLSQYRSQLSAEEYVNQSISAAEDNSLADHPVQPVFDLTRTAIQRDELAVAKAGDEAIRGIADETIENQIKNKRIAQINVPEGYDDRYADDNESAKVGLLFSPIVSRYLPRVALSSVDKNYLELTNSSIKGIGNIGTKGARYGSTTLADLSIISLYNDVLTVLPDSIEEDSAQKQALYYGVEKSLDIFGESLFIQDYQHFHKISSHPYEIMRLVDGVIPNEDLSHNSIINLLIESQVDWYKMVVNAHRDELREMDLSRDDLMGQKDFDRDFVDMEWKKVEHPNEIVSTLIHFRIHMMAISARNVTSTGWPDEGIPSPMFIKSAWRDLIEFALNNPPKNHAIILIRRYLEMLGYGEVEGSGPQARDVRVELQILLAEDGIIPFEMAMDEILKNPDHEDVFGYYAFRGLGRSFHWTPFSMYDYSDEFINVIKDIRSYLREKYWGEGFEIGTERGRLLDQYLDFHTEKWDSD